MIIYQCDKCNQYFKNKTFIQEYEIKTNEVANNPPNFKIEKEGHICNKCLEVTKRLFSPRDREGGYYYCECGKKGPSLKEEMEQKDKQL